jgi:hypothetical protein
MLMNILFTSVTSGLQQHWIDSLVNAPTLEHQKELWLVCFSFLPW